MVAYRVVSSSASISSLSLCWRITIREILLFSQFIYISKRNLINRKPSYDLLAIPRRRYIVFTATKSNWIHPNIQLIVDLEKNNMLPFLDVLGKNQLMENCVIVYRKSIHQQVPKSRILSPGKTEPTLVSRSFWFTKGNRNRIAELECLNSE